MISVTDELPMDEFPMDDTIDSIPIDPIISNSFDVYFFLNKNIRERSWLLARMI